MIYMWFTGINYCKLAVEKDRDSIFTTYATNFSMVRFLHIKISSFLIILIPVSMRNSN